MYYLNNTARNITPLLNLLAKLGIFARKLNILNKYLIFNSLILSETFTLIPTHRQFSSCFLIHLYSKIINNRFTFIYILLFCWTTCLNHWQSFSLEFKCNSRIKPLVIHYTYHSPTLSVTFVNSLLILPFCFIFNVLL